MTEFEPKITTSARDEGDVSIGERSFSGDAVVISFVRKIEGKKVNTIVFKFCWSQSPENCKVCVNSGSQAKNKCESYLKS